jgi:hypothetical protein
MFGVLLRLILQYFRNYLNNSNYFLEFSENFHIIVRYENNKDKTHLP